MLDVAKASEEPDTTIGVIQMPKVFSQLELDIEFSLMHIRNMKRTAAPVLMTTLAVVAIAISAQLMPSPLGLGTHEQMGLPPCSFLIDYGRPCPFCGMTTSFSLVVRGRVLDGMKTQPLGALLALSTLLVPFYSAFVLIGKRNFFPVWYYQHWKRLLVASGALCVLSWLYKIWAYADLFAVR